MLVAVRDDLPAWLQNGRKGMGMYRGRGFVFAAVFSVGLFGGSPTVFAQDPAEELRKTVEALKQQLEAVQKQLAELEKKQQETAAAVEAAPAAAAPERPKDSFDVFWKEGIRLETPPNEDGVQPFKLRISGRLQNDWFWGDGDSDLDTVASTENGVEFRRARIAIGGTIYEDFIFNTEYDFVGADDGTEFKDVYLGAQNIPVVGTARLGHYKEFGSLDELTSDNDTMFIERALPNVFVPSRNVGLGVNNAFLDERMSVGLGVFRDTDDFGMLTGDENDWAFTGRVTGVPWRSADGKNLVHLGVWGSIRGTENDDFRVRQRPEIHLAPRFIDTFDDIGAIDGMSMVGAEAGVTYARFSAMGEYIMQNLDRTAGGDTRFWGAYVQAGVFLTDDHRAYKAEEGIFDKVKPKKNVQIGKDGGPGAWEAALRYSHLDLDDGGVEAGTMDDITLGLNWYLNPNLRWSLNYVHAWVERDNVIVIDDGTPDEVTLPAIDGAFDGVVTRFQVTW